MRGLPPEFAAAVTRTAFVVSAGEVPHNDDNMGAFVHLQMRQTGIRANEAQIASVVQATDMQLNGICGTEPKVK